jgi:hypothetical protein
MSLGSLSKVYFRIIAFLKVTAGLSSPVVQIYAVEAAGALYSPNIRLIFKHPPVHGVIG